MWIFSFLHAWKNFNNLFQFRKQDKAGHGENSYWELNPPPASTLSWSPMMQGWYATYSKKRNKRWMHSIVQFYLWRTLDSLRRDNGASMSKFCLFSTVKVEETGAAVSILVELPLTAFENVRTGLISVDLNDLGRLIVVDGKCLSFLICGFGNA
ncbi:hypothetical protein CEXT_117981 [Caerostris extrusa]|uniref:Uncharacterized protein n=1 Tax=Caerostris extrusa TaxID=172846 RepID=A0AAV4XW23_CAEEX|nr:hypothetical protein CEXT_117981 [Caerostris extrusa]